MSSQSSRRSPVANFASCVINCSSSFPAPSRSCRNLLVPSSKNCSKIFLSSESLHSFIMEIESLVGPREARNKKTIEKEAAQAAAGIGPVKRAPGRPKGRKNNSTLAREAVQAVIMLPESEKRKRGRPAGSKDKQPRTRRTKAEMNRMREALD